MKIFGQLGMMGVLATVALCLTILACQVKEEEGKSKGLVAVSTPVPCLEPHYFEIEMEVQEYVDVNEGKGLTIRSTGEKKRVGVGVYRDSEALLHKSLLF